MKISFTTSYHCSICGSELEVKMIDELRSGNLEVFLSPCLKCFPRNIFANMFLMFRKFLDEKLGRLK